MKQLADISLFENLQKYQTQGCLGVFNKLVITNRDVAKSDTLVPPDYADVMYSWGKRPYDDLLSKAQKQANELEEQVDEGVLSVDEKHNKVLDLWANTSDQVDERMMKGLLAAEKLRRNFPDWDSTVFHDERGKKAVEKTEKYINKLSPKEKQALVNEDGFYWSKLYKLPIAYGDMTFTEWYEQLYKNENFRFALRDVGDIDEDTFDHRKLTLDDIWPDPWSTRATKREIGRRKPKEKKE